MSALSALIHVGSQENKPVNFPNRQTPSADCDPNSEPILRHVQCISSAGLHRVAYWQWGDPDNEKVLVCVHGLTRQGRDFDSVARTMCADYRVLAVDVAGRGQSDRLRNPMDYQVLQYVSDMVTVLAQARAKTVHWLGTSMGGLIGMALASLENTPIQRLILNDVGPNLEPSALQRIGTYVGLPMRWNSVEEGAAYLRSIALGFGPHTDEQWLQLSRPQFRRDGDQWISHYDPGLALPLRAATPESAAEDQRLLWQAYDAIRCPTLLIRGEDSDLLTADTALEMTRRGPKAQLCVWSGVGHAPTLMQPYQLDVVRSFLLAADAQGNDHSP